jgi:NAD(P)-dependent dehydrogenase (short-subunit alcohol dehydrogenase family)
VTSHGPQPSQSLALVTGATSGLGRGIAQTLSQRGWTVLVHGRDKRRCDELVAELRAAGGAAQPYVADLSSLSEAAELGRRVAREHPSLNLLINNAGVGFGADQRHREQGKDGYELRLSVNYLAQVVLTTLLKEPLRAAGNSQILNVGSVGQSPLDFDDPQFTRGYDGAEAYMRSKFALAAFTFSTAQDYRADGIRVNCVHPGNFLDTGMTREAGISPMGSVADGVFAILNATEEGWKDTTGTFFNGMRPGRANREAYDADVQQRLASLTGLLLSNAVGDHLSS